MTETAIKKDTDEPEIDGELLKEAQRHTGAAWPNETINVALRELVEERRRRRREALADLRRMSKEGLFDYGALEAAEQ